ncbi:MAG: hypothetical protein ACKN9V_05405 [Pseudomonadota bacterium]
MRHLFSLLTVAVFSACAGNSIPVFHSLAPTQNAQWNEAIPSNKETPTLREVYDHRAPWEDGIVYVEGKKVSKMTTPAGTIAHELVHGINSYLRSLKKNHPAFYVPTLGALFLKPTQAKRIQIASFIPFELRGMDGNGSGRFHDYIQTKSGTEPDAGTYFDPTTGKKLWGETDIFYIWDEWNAYIYGGRTDLEAELLHGKEDWDSMTGPVEFMIYSLGGLMALNKWDVDYYKSPAFQEAKAAFAFLTEETIKLLSDGEGSSLKPERANAYLERFRQSQSTQAETLRRFVRKEFGEVWAKNILDI